MPGVEAPAEDPVGGGVEGGWEGEKPVHDPGPPCRWEVQPGGTKQTSSPLRMWEGRSRLRETRGSRHLSGSAGRVESGKKRGRRRRRSWVLRGDWALERSYRCSYPHPPSWHPPSTRRTGALFFCSFCSDFSFLRSLFWIRLFFFAISLLPVLSSWDRPGRRAKEGLQRTTTARTADAKHGQKVRRHSLDRLHASINIQKKIVRKQ